MYKAQSRAGRRLRLDTYACNLLHHCIGLLLDLNLPQRHFGMLQLEININNDLSISNILSKKVRCIACLSGLRPSSQRRVYHTCCHTESWSCTRSRSFLRLRSCCSRMMLERGTAAAAGEAAGPQPLRSFAELSSTELKGWVRAARRRLLRRSYLYFWRCFLDFEVPLLVALGTAATSASRVVVEVVAQSLNALRSDRMAFVLVLGVTRLQTDSAGETTAASESIGNS